VPLLPSLKERDNGTKASLVIEAQPIDKVIPTTDNPVINFFMTIPFIKILII
jgi:hypothetical protein